MREFIVLSSSLRQLCAYLSQYSALFSAPAYYVQHDTNLVTNPNFNVKIDDTNHIIWKE